MSATRLMEIRRITGRIVVETGLHIGASAETMEISGLDNPIVRNPADNMPYIPGSSLKGRMRSLAEWYFEELPENGEVTKPILTARTSRVFGIPAQDPRKAADEPTRQAVQRGPTRLIVRDAPLTEESARAYASGRPLTEVKSENSINRLTSMANPRPMERVLPGVAFQMEMLYRIFDVDGDAGEIDRRLFDDVLLYALALVEADALGGNVSRGCGKVRFEDLKCSTNGDQQTRGLQLPELIFPGFHKTA